MIKSVVSILLPMMSSLALALDPGQKAPLFTAKNQEGIEFSLNQNENKNWTVLYFYPKAETPGCTKQACAFRDAIKVIEKENAKVYGVSTDSVAALAKFKAHHKLTFDLLSDEDGKICALYQTKMPLVTYSKRHTFIIDPHLVIRHIDRDVDPAMDAKKVADILVKLQKNDLQKKEQTP